MHIPLLNHWHCHSPSLSLSLSVCHSEGGGVLLWLSAVPIHPCPPPPPPKHSVGPNFSHHKARVQAVGWFPLGTRKQGSRPFAAPTPPNRNGAGPKAGPAPPPPPACPRTLTAGRHMVIEVPQGADAERRVCWDLGPAW